MEKCLRIVLKIPLRIPERIALVVSGAPILNVIAKQPPTFRRSPILFCDVPRLFIVNCLPEILSAKGGGG